MDQIFDILDQEYRQAIRGSFNDYFWSDDKEDRIGTAVSDLNKITLAYENLKRALQAQNLQVLQGLQRIPSTA